MTNPPGNFKVSFSRTHRSMREKVIIRRSSNLVDQKKNISPVISQKNIVGLPTSILVSAIYLFNAEKVIPTVNYHYQPHFYPILPFVIFAYTVLWFYTFL